MSKDIIKKVLDEAKGYSFDKPSSSLVKSYNDRSTEDLTGMHDRWSKDHADKKSNPSTSQKLLAVHSILKNRGENVSLPQHPNLGMTTYNESIGIIGTSKYQGPQFYGAVPRSPTAKMKVSGIRKKAKQKRLNKLEEKELVEFKREPTAQEIEKAAEVIKPFVTTSTTAVKTRTPISTPSSGGALTTAARQNPAIAAAAAIGGARRAALDALTGGRVDPSTLPKPSDYFRTSPVEPEIIPPTKPSTSTAVAPRVGRIIDVAPLAQTATQAITQAQPQRLIPSDTKTKTDQQKKPKRKPEEDSKARGRTISSVQGPQGPGSFSLSPHVDRAEVFGSPFSQNVRESNQDMGSEERKKIKYVERKPDAKKPTDTKSALGREASVIKKILDEAKKEKKNEKMELEGGKTQVDINPNLKKPPVEESIVNKVFTQALTPHSPLKKIKLPKFKIRKIKGVKKEW